MADRTNAIQSTDQKGAEQFGRKYKLVVFNRGGKKDVLDGLDLSELRVKFSVKRTSSMTPNVADIRVYNMSPETISRVGSQKEFNSVLLEAGYDGNYGVIFEGNIKQLIEGRESATDTFIDIVAGDGDHAFNFAVVNTTLAAGSHAEDHIAAAITPMDSLGVKAGYMSPTSKNTLPRGKTMWGNSKDFLRLIAKSNDKDWSIQDGKVVFIGQTEYLKGQRVVLTSKTGMIGTPQQTNEGINIKCLLNPTIRVNGLVEINNKSVERLKIDLSNPKSQVNTAAPLSHDGVYYVLVIEYAGDTRGIDWYTTMLCLNTSISTTPFNAVSRV